MVRLQKVAALDWERLPTIRKRLSMHHPPGAMTEVTSTAALVQVRPAVCCSESQQAPLGMGRGWMMKGRIE